MFSFSPPVSQLVSPDALDRVMDDIFELNPDTPKLQTNKGRHAHAAAVKGRFALGTMVVSGECAVPSHDDALRVM